MWQAISRRRIDAVVEWEHETWIVEVKAILSLMALGQVLGYWLLWVRQNGRRNGIIPVIVCEASDQETRDVCSYYDVVVITLSHISHETERAAPPPV